MGVLNITPDSFSDGGQTLSPHSALVRARSLCQQGAAIIDVGGESTRPRANPVSLQQELDRVIPVIEAMHAELPVPISVDTSKPQVMREAVAAGAGMINDVRALREEGALVMAAELGVPVCMMHMQGEPATMQHQVHYHDVVTEVRAFLQARIEACRQAGIPGSRVLIDPGFGFGKDLSHNLLLLKHLPALLDLKAAIVVGLSRKSMIAAILDLAVDQRLHASVALATLAVWRGASLVRAHDVGPTLDAIRVSHAVKTVHDPRG